jgi:hypothetical protein
MEEFSNCSPYDGFYCIPESQAPASLSLKLDRQVVSAQRGISLIADQGVSSASVRRFWPVCYLSLGTRPSKQGAVSEQPTVSSFSRDWPAAGRPLWLHLSTLASAHATNGDVHLHSAGRKTEGWKMDLRRLEQVIQIDSVAVLMTV